MKYFLAAWIFLFTLTLEAGGISGKIISTRWLSSHLYDEDLRIVDVRPTLGSYWKSHLPGAVYLSPDLLRVSLLGVPGKLIPPEVFSLILGRLGIARNTTVVVYGENSDFYATYLIWALDSIGHRTSAILDGGYSKWQGEQLILTQDYPIILPRIYLGGSVDEKIRAQLPDVEDAVIKKTALLVDARSSEMFKGEKGDWKRKGHIPGAINHSWEMDLQGDGTWKSMEELTKSYRLSGINADTPVITTCGQGLQSAHTYFTLRYLLELKNVRNYDGGFSEWSNLDKLPVEQ
ncbi:MAG: sulfurtransferase [Candidatus Wallbacteria bacterium]|nr:sulfurtransferase [Candidatus Wallbacteria bacterium]